MSYADEDTDTHNPDLDNDVYNNSTGEKLDNRESIIEQLFNTERRLEFLRRSWRGEELRNKGKDKMWVKIPNKELAGDRFINKQISALRCTINETNSFTRKDDKECRFILWRSLDAFIRDLVNEPTVNKNDMRTLTMSYWAALELFLGLVEFGHGSKVLRDALAGINSPEMSNNNKKSISDWFRSN